MDQIWIKTDKGTEVEIDCIVHSNPQPQVNMIQIMAMYRQLTDFKDTGHIPQTRSCKSLKG
jgi:hypothetical protein